MTTTAEVFATTELVERPLMGGQGVDVLDAEWNIDRKGGCTSASIDVVPPKSISRYADNVNEPVAICDTNHHGLWEGRVAEPDIAFVEADRLTIEATGYSGYLSDDEYFRRCYVDGIIASWQIDQATSYASVFSVGIEDDDKLVLRVAADLAGTADYVHLKDGYHCRAYWQLFDGIPTTQMITACKFHYQDNNVNTGATGLQAKLYGRDALSGGSFNRLIWTAPATSGPYYNDSGDVSLDATDIGSDVTCLVWRLEQVGDQGYAGQTDPALDAWDICDGIAYDDLRVYASDLGANVTPERIVRDAVRTLVDDDHIDFPDVSGYVLEHADFSDPTTVGQLIEDVNQMLDWNYGFDDGQTFFYRKPWTPATVPLGELIVTSFVDPNLGEWGVRRDWQDCCNKVVAHYTKKNGRVGSVTVSDAEGPLGAQWKTKFLDLTDTCNSSTDATLVATQRLRDGLWPKPTGSIPMSGDAHLAVGIDVPAIYLRPGMMVVNLDVQPEKGGRMLVTSVAGRLVGRSITLEVGTRSTRLDRLMARRELGAKRRPRRKAKR
jgi:hypothetical protein